MTPLLAQRSRADRSFERMYRRHVGDVYRYALAVLRNPADAEDVTQTTFLNAYRAMQQGERPEKPQNWLIRIAHNVCRQRFRQAARRPNEVVFDEDLAEAVPLDTDGPSAEDLTRALSHLAFNQRSALVMRELEGRSYAEIAQALDLSVSAVETLLFRARRAVREQLEGSLTCHEAELAISRQLDGRLPRPERGPLRAHLRECKECETFARSQRAQRSAWKGLAAIPLPSSLASFFGGGGGAAVGAGTSAVGFGVGAKAAAVVAATAVAGGVGYEGVRHNPWRETKETQAAARVPVPVQPRALPITAAVPVLVRAGAAASANAELAREKAGAAKLKADRRRKAKQAFPPGRAQKVAGRPAVPQEPQGQGRPALATTPAAPPAQGKAVGLARSEQAARDKKGHKPEPVGLARSEARSRAKSKAKPEPQPQSSAPPPAAVPPAGEGTHKAGSENENAAVPPAPPAPPEQSGGKHK